MREAYGKPMATLGQGGSIPLCNVFADTYPDAEIILMGVEEPLALIHAPNESVDPSEIASMALAEALFLQRYARARPLSPVAAAASQALFALAASRCGSPMWEGCACGLPQRRRSRAACPWPHDGGPSRPP